MNRSEVIEVLRGLGESVFEDKVQPPYRQLINSGWFNRSPDGGRCAYYHKVLEPVFFSDVFGNVLNKKNMIQCLRRDFEDFGAVIAAHQTMVDGWIVDTIGERPSILVLRNDSGDRIFSTDVFGDNLTQLLEYGEPKPNKYNRQCKGVTIDVYDVLKAFEVTDPALQHLIKKALCAGLRGHKNLETDLNDILESAKRAVELNV